MSCMLQQIHCIEWRERIEKSVTLTNQTMLMKNTAFLLHPTTKKESTNIINFVTFGLQTLSSSLFFSQKKFCKCMQLTANVTCCYCCCCCLKIDSIAVHIFQRSEKKMSFLFLRWIKILRPLLCNMQLMCLAKRKDNTNAQIPCFVLQHPFCI